MKSPAVDEVHLTKVQPDFVGFSLGFVTGPDVSHEDKTAPSGALRKRTRNTVFVHDAFRVLSDVNDFVSVISVVSSNHPLKTCLAFTGVGRLTLLTSLTVIVLDPSSVPPSGSNVIVCSIGTAVIEMVIASVTLLTVIVAVPSEFRVYTKQSDVTPDGNS